MSVVFFVICKNPRPPTVVADYGRNEKEFLFVMTTASDDELRSINDPDHQPPRPPSSKVIQSKGVRPRLPFLE